MIVHASNRRLHRPEADEEQDRERAQAPENLDIRGASFWGARRGCNGASEVDRRRTGRAGVLPFGVSPALRSDTAPESEG